MYAVSSSLAGWFESRIHDWEGVSAVSILLESHENSPGARAACNLTPYSCDNN